MRGEARGPRRAERPAAGQRAFPLPAARVSLSSRRFSRRQNMPPPGPFFPALYHARHIRAPMQTAGCRAGQARLCAGAQGICPYRTAPGKKHKQRRMGQAGCNSTGACPAAGRVAGCRIKGLSPPCRPRLTFRPSFLLAAKHAAPPAPLSRRCAAKPYRMRRAGGAHAVGSPRPVLPDFYHFYPILEYCLF